MPTPVMHLALAEELLTGERFPAPLHRLLAEQRGPFLLGSTAPDVQTMSGQRRAVTHFYTIPPTTDRPAHATMLAAHPELAQPNQLSPAHAAFLAGYIAHLMLDQLWLARVFHPYFGREAGWGAWPERLLLHNVLRTWLDREDLPRLDSDIGAVLGRTEPRGWLPFVADHHLQMWRDWLAEQLAPGAAMRTTEVFAGRLGVPAAELEAVLDSPEQMEEQVFRHIPPSVLKAFRQEGKARSSVLIEGYLKTTT